MPIIRIQNLNGSKEFNYYSGRYNPKIFVQSGQLLFAWSGSKGTSFGPHIWKGQDALLNYHTWKLLIDYSKVNPGYFYHVLKILTVIIEDKAHGASALVHTQKREMEQFYIPHPPTKKEQQAIAQAISDVDGLIDRLQRLIAKKQDIKTAAMQQLLTGKTRLPGFGEGMGYQQTDLGEIPEDWDVLTYGNVFKFLRTANNSRAELSFDGDFGYVHYGDIHTKWSTRLDLNQYKLPMISSKKLRKLDFVNDGDLIMADASEDYDGIGCSVEVGNIKRRKIVSGLHTFLMRDPMKIFVDGYREYLHLIRPVKQAMIRLATGLKVYGLSKSNLKNIQIPVPPKLEQRAIAQALSDMDEELEALQSRLNKTKAIKQGMMQELLTGKTRLI